MKQLELELKNKKTQDEIEHMVKNICKIMPKTINAQCTKFVDQYAELIITLLATAPPKELCSNMMLCANQQKNDESKGKNGVFYNIIFYLIVFLYLAEIMECAVCHAASETLAKLYEDNDNSLIVNHVIDKTCTMIPGKYYQEVIFECIHFSLFQLFLFFSSYNLVC